MTTENLKFPLITQHNAEYPREIQAAKEVSRLLTKVDFPGQDVWVDLRFDYSLVEHSSSNVDVILIRGQPHGIVRINLQALYLMQDFESMLMEVIPHELAHVLHDVKAKVDGFTIDKVHDDAWQHLVFKLQPDSEPLPKVRGEFDDRAVRLSKGGILIQCECGEEESFAVVADTAGNSAKLRTEDHKCGTCKFPYHRVDGQTLLPQRIKDDLAFLEKIKCIKFQHPHLQR